MLQSTYFSNKGQWLVKLEDDPYVGLAGTGIKVQSGSKWIDEAREGLFREIDQDSVMWATQLSDMNPLRDYKRTALNLARHARTRSSVGLVIRPYPK